jgi:hypothetical protein
MKKIRRITDMGTFIQAIFADLAGSIKISEGGLDLSIMGALNTAIRVGPAATIRVFNAGGATAYVAFGIQGMAAPTSPLDGIPVPSGQYLVVNSGDKEWVRASAATMFGYQGDAA